MPCGAPHVYQNIDKIKIDKIIETLKNNGGLVSGTNPWKVDTNKLGIKLLGTWDRESSNLTVEVTDKSFLVPCQKIWETLDPIIFDIAGSDIV
jgi:hypothetical protein